MSGMMVTACDRKVFDEERTIRILSVYAVDNDLNEL